MNYAKLHDIYRIYLMHKIEEGKRKKRKKKQKKREERSGECITKYEVSRYLRSSPLSPTPNLRLLLGCLPSPHQFLLLLENYHPCPSLNPSSFFPLS